LKPKKITEPKKDPNLFRNGMVVHMQGPTKKRAPNKRCWFGYAQMGTNLFWFGNKSKSNKPPPPQGVGVLGGGKKSGHRDPLGSHIVGVPKKDTP